MDDKKRVPEGVVSELKTLALLREPCTLQFQATNGGISNVHTKLTDVFEDDDGQYLLAADGLTLQLHQLIAINGKPLESFC